MQRLINNNDRKKTTPRFKSIHPVPLLYIGALQFRPEGNSGELVEQRNIVSVQRRIENVVDYKLGNALNCCTC